MFRITTTKNRQTYCKTLYINVNQKRSQIIPLFMISGYDQAIFELVTKLDFSFHCIIKISLFLAIVKTLLFEFTATLQKKYAYVSRNVEINFYLDLLSTLFDVCTCV